MASIIIQCEVCQQKLTIPIAARGKRAQCPACGHTFTIIEPKATTPIGYATPMASPVLHNAVPVRDDLARRAEGDDWEDQPSRRNRPRKANESSSTSPLLAFCLIFIVVLVVAGATLFVAMKNNGNNNQPWAGNGQNDDDANVPFNRRPVPGGPNNKGQLPAVPLDRKILDRVKAATVFIKVHQGMESATGTGFLIHRVDKVGFFITNHHVISPDSDKRQQRNPFAMPRPPQPPGIPRPVIIQIVLNSGTPQEQTIRAQVVASSREPDLALLVAESNELTMEPLSIAAPQELMETQRLYFFGFPFGAEFAEGRANPAVQVKQGTISAVQRDFRGSIRKIQVECDLNPGNSGGPAVNAEGQLVGVAESILLGTNIGNLIHPQFIQTLIQNKEKGPIKIEVVKEDGQYYLEVQAPVVDFQNRINGAELVVRVIASDDDFAFENDAHGAGQVLQKAERAPMNRTPSGFFVKTPLNWDSNKDFKLAYQVIYKLKDRGNDVGSVYEVDARMLAGWRKGNKQETKKDQALTKKDGQEDDFKTKPETKPPDRNIPRHPLSGFDAPERKIGKIIAPKDIPDLVAYWSFDDSDGETVKDEASEAHTGTIKNGRIVQGVRGKGLQLNGPESYMAYEGDAPFNYQANEAFTYACWVRTTARGGVVFSQRDENNGSPLISVNLEISGMVIAQVRDDRHTDFQPAAEIHGKRINDGRWHHLALTRNREGEIALYIDGASGTLMPHLKPSNPQSGIGSITTTTRTWGADLHWAKSHAFFRDRAFWQGTLDECCIYRRCLKLEEIRKLAGVED